jgi:putative resolvase
LTFADNYSMKTYRVHEVAEQLNVGPHAVRSYVKKGLLECYHTPSGQRVFTQEQVDAFTGVTKESIKRIGFYARSSNGDKTLIQNQFVSLNAAFGEPIIEISDKSSGLNDKRPGLRKLINLAKQGEITHVAITQQDRLTRFGYGFIEEILNSNGVEILILGTTLDKSLQEELMQDFMNLIASFSGKFYRLRGYEQQRLLLKKASEYIDEKAE